MTTNSNNNPPGRRSFGPKRTNPIRIRSKRLDELDEDKIALAYWLLAKQLVEDKSQAPDPDTNESSDEEAA